MNYKKFSDERLALIAKNEQDGEAQKILFERYAGAVHSVVNSYFFKEGDREDLFQEGMMGLYKAVRTYDGSSKFKTYAFTCIKSGVVSALRKSNAQKRAADATAVSFAGLLGDGEEDKNSVMTDSAPNPETEYINNESAEELSNRIKVSLSAAEHEILLLRLDGFSYKEISEKLGKNVKSVDNTVQRIRKKLLNVKEDK